jgi:predicted Zn-dependent protease
MLKDILRALEARSDLAAWTVRHIRTRGTQVYAVPTTVEAQRAVTNERYVVDVLRKNPGPDGGPTVGTGNATLLPGDEIRKAVDAASLMAGLAHNPPHKIPGPTKAPNVPLADPALQADPASYAEDLMIRLHASASAYPKARLTSAECFAEEKITTIRNSRGLEAEQTATRIDIEWVLQAKDDGREAESFTELTRRRAADFDLEGELRVQAERVIDLLSASPPPDFEGAVVLRGETLRIFFEAGVLQTLGSAASKYRKYSEWELGKAVFKGEAHGDPLSVWANRSLPYGTRSDRFDDEGLPAQRLELIRRGVLRHFSASQRYSDYLHLPATGEFGNVEVPAGRTPAKQLLQEPHVEVVAFSWFDPDPITGEFASEIRQGYLVQNHGRKAFKGGLLVGNYLEALADARWSAETGFFGSYAGPETVRFAKLRVAGKQ